MKLFKQLSAILLLITVFALFDFAIYNIFTRRYINNSSAAMNANSVELDRYLPFDENSEIVKLDSELTLSGDLPTVDGAAALYPVFSAFVNAVYPEESVSFDGESFTADSALQYSNTKGAYTAVADGTADMIFCAKPSAEQLAYAEEQGAELEMIPIGCEAFVFIVNRDNPIDSLTVEQIRGIYSGEYKNWSQVGGDDTPIDAVQRSKGSGSQTTMLSFMGDTQMKRSPFGFMGRSIGYSFRYYVSDIAESSGVKMIALNGVYPNKENISDGSYPVVSSFYAVYRKDNDNPNIPVFIDWILSDKGQKIVEESGYVPIKKE